MGNKIIRNFIAKQVAGRSDDGIMITLSDPKKIDFQVAMMEDLLMRNGIDPRAITSENQFKGILNLLKSLEKGQTQSSGITGTKSAKIFNIEGQSLDPNKPIIGGTQTGKELSPELSERLRGTNVDRIKQKIADRKIESDEPPPGSRGGKDDIAAPVQSAEETLKNMIMAENKKNIAAMKKRKMLDDAIEDASPGFSGDRKIDAELVAENLAERMGMVYDDLPTKERIKLYDEAFTGLSKKKTPPEDLATGGRVGLKDGISLENILEGKIPPMPMPDPLQKILEKMTPEEKEMFKIRMEIMRRGFEINPPENPEGVKPVPMPTYPKENKADGGIARIGLKDGMNRRTFLKILGGAMSIPIIGKFFKPVKVGKKVTKVPIIQTDKVAGKPEWFDQLVNKVILEGDDVTKNFATKDREVVHLKKFDDDTNVMVTQDLDEGAVRVEYNSADNVYGDPVQLRYKKPNPDEGDPRPVAEFDTAESYPVGRADGPDDYSIDIDEVGGTSISDLTSDVSKLKEYATGQKQTLKEFVQSKKRKDKARKITEGGEGEMDAVIERQGEFIENDLVDLDPFASGGIARMLGE